MELTFLANRLLGKGEPELAGLERYGVVAVLRAEEHVLDDVVDVGDEAVHPHLVNSMIRGTMLKNNKY
jgi:hypothetical protein